MRQYRVQAEPLAWPLRNGGTLRSVAVSVEADGHIGRGEAVPVLSRAETMDYVLHELNEIGSVAALGLTRRELNEIFPSGAARNALDCAMWDHEARAKATTAWQIAGMKPPKRISGLKVIDRFDDLDARDLAHAPALRFSASPDTIETRLKAVRDAAPGLPLVVDGETAWNATSLTAMDGLMADHGVAMLIRPFSRYEDEALLGLDLTTPICASESCNSRADVPALIGKYRAGSITLDKAGGLTEALELARSMRAAGLSVLIEAGRGSSRAAAPLLVLAPYANFADFSALAALKADVPHCLSVDDHGTIAAETPDLWGSYAPATGQTEPKKRAPARGRPRSEALETAILNATVKVIAEVGYHEMSLEKVAEAASSSRPTIYRRWNSKQNLAAAAIANRFHQAIPAVPDTGNARRDLEVLLIDFVDLLRHDKMDRVILSLIPDIGRDDELGRVVYKIEIGRRLFLAQAIMRGRQRGEAGMEQDIDRMIDMLAGGVYFRMMFRDGIPSDDEIVGFVDIVLGGPARAQG